MNELKYRVIIEWLPADEAYVASIPELPGCMAHGSTYEAALANIQDAARFWLDTARDDGIPIPAPLAADLAGS